MAQQIKKLFREKAWVEYQNDIYRQQSSHGYCGVCGKKTHYKSVYAAEYCCSEECSRELWYEIFVKLMTERKRSR
jgi:hypothetical protein